MKELPVWKTPLVVGVAEEAHNSYRRNGQKRRTTAAVGPTCQELVTVVVRAIEQCEDTMDQFVAKWKKREKKEKGTYYDEELSAVIFLDGGINKVFMSTLVLSGLAE